MLAVAATQLTACGYFFGNDTPDPPPLQTFTPDYPISQAWSTNIGALGQIELRPLVEGDTVTLATSGGRVVSLNAATGAELWSVNVGEPILAGVGGDGHTYAVVTGNGEVVALRNGKVLWRHTLPVNSYTPPLVAGGRVFVISVDRSLRALDGNNGAQIWARESIDSDALTLQDDIMLTSVGNTLVIGVSGRVSGIDPDNGALLWDAAITVPRGLNDVERLVDIVGEFNRVGNSLCGQAFHSAIGCVNTSTGQTMWSQNLSGMVGLSGDAQSVFSIDGSDRVQGWDRSNGNQLWLSDNLMYRNLSAPLLLGRALIIGDGGGLLHILNRNNGHTLNRLQTNSSGIRIAPVLVGTTLVVVTNNGTVYGFHPG